MIRPNFCGDIVTFNLPTQDTLTTAQIAAIDSGAGGYSVYPYARSGTVQDNEEELSMSIAAQTLVNSQRLAFGAFLSADNDKGNLMFRCTGSMFGSRIADGVQVTPIFGRTNVSTVTSSKAAQSNILANWIPLHCDTTYFTLSFKCSFNQLVYGKYVSSGTPWFCGWLIENNSGADRDIITISNVNFTKFAGNFEVYKTDRI